MDKLEPLSSMGASSHWAEVKVGFPFDSQHHFGTQPGELKGASQIHVHRKHYSNRQKSRGNPSVYQQMVGKVVGWSPVRHKQKDSLDTGYIVGET